MKCKFGRPHCTIQSIIIPTSLKLLSFCKSISMEGVIIPDCVRMNVCTTKHVLKPILETALMYVLYFFEQAGHALSHVSASLLPLLMLKFVLKGTT